MAFTLVTCSFLPLTLCSSLTCLNVPHLSVFGGQFRGFLVITFLYGHRGLRHNSGFCLSCEDVKGPHEQSPMRVKRQKLPPANPQPTMGFPSTLLGLSENFLSKHLQIYIIKEFLSLNVKVAEEAPPPLCA